MNDRAEVPSETNKGVEAANRQASARSVHPTDEQFSPAYSELNLES